MRECSTLHTDWIQPNSFHLYQNLVFSGDWVGMVVYELVLTFGARQNAGGSCAHADWNSCS